MRRADSRGFTIFEILLVVIAIGLLSAMVVGGFSNILPAGKEAVAVNKARCVNAARVSYSLTVPNAATQWAACATDTDKATLLVNATCLSGLATDWLSSDGGYTLSLSGSLPTKTVLTDKNGNTLNYPD